MRLLSVIPIFLVTSLFSYDPCPEYGTLFPATPCIDEPCCPSGMFWTADVSLLVWQAREEGLNYALKNNPLPIEADVNVNGSLIGLDFSWDPAVKVTLGAAFPDRAWDTEFRWTYFHSDSSHTTHTDSPRLLPLWAFPNADIATEFLYGTARGALEFNLNTFDIEMGYHPFLTPALSIRFNAGLKVALINQDFTVKYSDGFTNGTAQLNSAHTALTNKTIGTGPRIGFNSKWRVGQGFSLLASISGALPLWHYRVTRIDTDLGIDAGSPKEINGFFKERFWIFRSILETALGLGWDTCFGCKSQFPFGVAANYEFQYVAEQNMMSMLVNPGILNQIFHSRGDLQLHGASLTFQFGF